MKLATTLGDFGVYTDAPIESIKYVSQAGFKYADYDFGMEFDSGKGLFSDDWKKCIEDIKREADRCEITFVQSHAPMGLGTPIVPGEERARLIAGTNRSIECCAALGISNVVVHTGYARDVSKEMTFEKNKAFYDEILETAEKFGVNVLAENFNAMCCSSIYWIDNAPDLRALIDYIGHPLLHACWDAGHANMLETPQDESLRVLGDHVYVLYVQDNFGKKDDDQHIVPFCETLNLDSLMHGLTDINYKGYFTFEACNILTPYWKRRPFDTDKRLYQPPLSLRIKAEEFLYEIGKRYLLLMISTRNNLRFK